MRATPVVMTLDPLLHWMKVRWMPSGAEHVMTALSPWTTVIRLLGVSERVRGGGGAEKGERERERERERNSYVHVKVL